MDVRQYVTADVRRRADLLPREAAKWKERSSANEEGMGIHRSQIAAIVLLLDELQQSQEEVLADLDPTLEPRSFAERRFEAEQELGATHGVAAIFRYVFAQRDKDGPYRTPLDTADLIAADCYQPCIKLAQSWGAIGQQQYREPPLTYLNAAYSPMAITRRHNFGAFKLPLATYEELPLPISVVSLPFHHAVALWTYSSLYHEVGHPLDQDLGLTEALAEPLRQRLKPPDVDPDRAGRWQGWLREIVADAFGILLGGAGFAQSMTETLFLPESEVTTISVEDAHPNPYVRIFLLGALLRHLDLPAFTTVADGIEQQWKEVYGEPAEPAAYLKDCQAVAEVVLDEPLPRLNDQHRLRDFAPDLAGDNAMVERLGTYLRSGFNRPQPDDVSIRFVPAAAQLAVRGVTENHTETLDAIQKRADAFIAAMETPEFLAGPPPPMTPQREEYLRGLVRKARVRSPAQP